MFCFDYPNVWTALRDCKEPIILYGMGDGADKVLREFDKRSIRAASVMASDDFVRYQDYRGFTVQKESDFSRQYDSFAVALCFGSSLPDVMTHIREVADRHTLLVPNVPVVGDAVMDDAFLTAHMADIETAYALLADDTSRQVYEGVLNFIYTGRLSYLDAVESSKDEAFTQILRLHNERYLDLGAYRGDTVDEFLHYTDGYTAVTAVEPNPKNYRKLCEYLADVKNATALNAGIADRDAMMYISKDSGRMAALNDVSGIEIPVTTVDSIDARPTYIKVDIEGTESAMLRGAIRTLQSRPKLNIAAYHRTEDFFSLVLQLHDINPEYQIYLRKHPYIPCWDLNIYAI